MIIKGIVDEDFSNYKKCSMFVIFPHCTLKCDHENKCDLCHNSSLMKEPNIEVTAEEICQRYLKNPLSRALVLGGLEPFDTPEDLFDLVRTFREKYDCADDIVIYTGYTEYELTANPLYQIIKSYGGIIIKFGRFRPNQKPHFDEVLGVELANDGQYAKKFGEVYDD